MNKYKKISLFLVLLSGQWITMQGSSALNQIKQVALTTSNNINMTIGDIENKDDYLKSHQNYSTIAIITNNLKDCAYILDARGDGNCGYRAFLASIFMNELSLQSKKLTPCLRQLLDEKYVQFFIKYDQQFSSNKNAIATEIKKYLTEQLNLLDNCKSIQDVHALLNKECAFNYYMIMFLRYLIVEYINTLNINRINTIINQRGDKISYKDLLIFNSATEEERLLAFAVKDDNITLSAYKQKILTWGDELTLDQTKLLSITTNITIYTILESNQYQPLAINETNQEYGVATILYVEGHYRLFIPRNYSNITGNSSSTSSAQDNFEFFKHCIDSSMLFSNELHALTHHNQNQIKYEYGYDDKGKYIGEDGIRNKEGKLEEFD